MERFSVGAIVLAVVAGAAPASAQPVEPAPPEQPPPEQPPPEQLPPAQPSPVQPPPRIWGFIEIFGSWGVELGVAQYVPDGRPDRFKYPFASGFGGGATAGYMLLPNWFSVFIDYRYGHANTVSGDIAGVLDQVHGEIDFHQLAFGARIEHPLGPGWAYAELAGGVIFPFAQSIELEYAPEVAAIGLIGRGRQKDNFGYGYGAFGEMGYKYALPLPIPRFYVGAGIRVAAFQSTNAGRNTDFTNFVADFRAVPPVPITATVHHSKNGPIPPETLSVQDIRLNLSIGYQF